MFFCCCCCSFLRGLDVPGLHHHLDLVLGAREQLDGPALAEAGAVHLEEDGPLVGLDPQRDGDVDDSGDAVHAAGSALLQGVGEGSGSSVRMRKVGGGRRRDAEDAAVLRRDRDQAGQSGASGLEFQNKSVFVRAKQGLL